MQSSASPSKSYFLQKNPKKLQKSVDKTALSEYNISCRRCFGREATDDDRVERSFGSALEWGSRGREFDSRHSDQTKIIRTCFR